MRLVIADDHPVVLVGIRTILSAQAGFEVVGEATSGAELLLLLDRVSCDMVITDFTMSAEPDDYDGLRLLSRLRAAHPDLPVLVLTMLNNPGLIQAMLAEGVRGIVEKMAVGTELVLAVHAARSGRIYLGRSVKRQLEQHASEAGRKRALSAREADVVRLIAQGISVTDIARQSGRSIRTISQQKRDAMRKLGLETDKQLHEYARSMGLI
jgi:two-component system, NarL family, captular synthesis response regulator RcsB